jgi:tetratricopeptide (TPR) repeat protein
MLIGQARDSLDGLAKEASRDPSLQRELAESYRQLALMEGDPFYINQGFGDKALRDLQRSLELHEAAAGQPDKNGLAMFAKTCWGIGDMLLREHPDKAIEHYRKSLKLYEQLIALDAANPRSYLAEAFAYAKLAGGLRRTGHTSDAITAYEKSVAIAEPFLVKEPEEAPRVLIPAYGSLGIMLQNTGKTTAALAYYKKSAGLNENLAAQMQNNAAVNGNLAFTFGRIATLEEQMGNIIEALSYSSRSMQMMEQWLDSKDQRSQENRRVSDS